MTEPDYMEQSNAISRRLGAIGMEESAAMLSEGFCPLCGGRGSTTTRVAKVDDRPSVVSKVECIKCLISWRSGMNAENGKDWIEHTVPISRKDMEATFSMCINPPPEPKGDWDDWHDDEEYDDDLDD